MPPSTRSKKTPATDSTTPNSAKVRKSSSRSSSMARKSSGTGKGKAAAVNPAASIASSTTPAEDETGSVFFWREYGHDYGFLSQWYESEWEHEGTSYISAEMWMMVSKARLFGDEAKAQQMLETTDPKAHKIFGRQVGNFDPQVWDDNKLRIVEEGNWHKFTKSKEAEELQKQLLATGDRELVEASPFDKIWGVGFAEKGADKNRHKWGQNLLGKALMTVRNRIREQEKAVSAQVEE